MAAPTPYPESVLQHVPSRNEKPCPAGDSVSSNCLPQHTASLSVVCRASAQNHRTATN
jgi:hypothetical protein